MRTLLLAAAVVACCSVANAQQRWTVQPRYHNNWRSGYTVTRQSDPFQRAWNQHMHRTFQQMLNPAPAHSPYGYGATPYKQYSPYNYNRYRYLR